MRGAFTGFMMGALVFVMSGCSVFFYPHAKEFAAKAKGANSVDTLINLTTMMEESAQKAQPGTGYDQPLNDLHNQFHAFDNTVCCVEKPKSETPEYQLLVTHNKELWAIFKRAWEFRDDQPQRRQHLELFSNEVRETRQTLEALK
ncbi:hypothetical protein YTPLAS18_32060 [Nitrospira sp.]|nr:hypothetical protein YTPLAS18_32060 [Nitrospira sp.]